MTKAGMITVLSIDGGAIRGIIPAVQLACLEQKLKDLDGDNFTKLADYFDLIAGTSTGGLMASMLAAPSVADRTKPVKEAKELPDFYETECPNIFPQPSSFPLRGPKYNGTYLRDKIKELVGETTVKETFTEVVVPAFEIKSLQPVIFSTSDAQTNPLKNAKLEDACIATSAAPPLLPAHKFDINTDDGQTRRFDVIDGGLAASNPTLVAITHVSQEILKHNTKFVDIEPMDTRRMLVLSLGCGEPKHEEKYNADVVNSWHFTQWLFQPLNKRAPLSEMFWATNFDMVDIHTSNLFQSGHSLDNYLRIQADNLEGDQATFDIATPENMRILKEIGQELLQKRITRVNLETGQLEEVEGGPTNEQALADFALKLSQERKRRLP